MSRILAVTPVLPEYSYSQAEIAAVLGEVITTDRNQRAVLERFHAGSGISRRYTTLPIERYRELASFEEANDIWIREGTTLATRAVSGALAASGLVPSDVDFLFFTSVTGVSAPSLDARLVPGTRACDRM